MIVGVPQKIKKDEYRVDLLPVGADLLTKEGHAAAINIADHKLVNAAIIEVFPDLASGR